MRLAFILFNGITWLDLIGVYDPLSRLKSMGYIPDLSWDFCAQSEFVKDDFGLTMMANAVDVNLDAYDAVIVPGGLGTRSLQYDEAFLEWFKTAEKVPLKISVCTGSLLLGAVGFLEEKSATSNPAVLESLQAYCKDVSEEKVVEDGNVITAGAVSASLDLGLYLCEKWSGEEARESVEKKMGYSF